MQREEMAGESLREGIVEVAFEQWTERQTAGCRKRQRSVGGMPADAQVGSNVFPALQGSGIGITRQSPVRMSVGKQVPVSAECRGFPLNLGGNTDERFALSISVLGAFSFRCRTCRMQAGQAGEGCRAAC